MFRLNAFYISLAALCILICSTSSADMVILKNGQTIKEVTIIDLWDTLQCESPTQTYYVDKKSVASIARTDREKAPSLIRRWADDLLASMPRVVKKHINAYQKWIFSGFLFLIAGIVLILILRKTLSQLIWLAQWMMKKRRLIQDIHHLDENEKAVLREFFLQAQNTLDLPVEDKTVAGLIHKGILEIVGSKGQYSVRGLMLPVMIAASAHKKMHPQSLGLPAVLTDENRKALNASRPAFIYEMAGFYQKLEKKPDIYW